MIHIEDTELEIGSLVCSDDFESRLGQKHVADLAESIRDIGLINKPWVRASDMKVICGEDRIAAHCMLGKDFVEVRVVECSDDEFAKVRKAENRYRRSPEQVKELVEAIEERIEEQAKSLGVEVEDDAPVFSSGMAKHIADKYSDDGDCMDPNWVPPKKGPGRPKTVHGAAIEEAAKQLGTTPNAVRKKLARATEKEGPPFETWGREAPEKIVKDARRAYEALTNAYSKITSAMAIITDMQKAGALRDNYDNETHEAWCALDGVAGFCKGQRPEALCPWCKGVKAAQKRCAHCLTTGFVPGFKVRQAPDELRERPAAVDSELGF